jgi:hypothetical protein
MFRKYEMSMKKETLHRTFSANAELIDHLFALYTSSNYHPEDEHILTFVNFLEDVENIYI